MKRFVSLGECMVELAPAAVPGDFRQGFAGDTFNTAWYAARLRPDWAVDYVTAVGRDAMSDAMLGFLEGAGVGTRHIQRHGDRTLGLYMISLKDGERSFSYWRGQAAARRMTQDRTAFAAALKDADMVYFSGISLGVQEGDGRDHMLELIASARAAGSTVAFDSNLRPKLWAATTEMTDWVMRAAAISDIVLPSHDDEAAFFGDASPLATRDRYLAAAATTVVVKNGPGVIEWAHEGATGQVHPDPVPQIIDTTAAGDSFNAGFFANLDQGIEAAIKAGAALSAKVIQGRGALIA